MIKTRLQLVKETVDFVHSYLAPFPDGCVFNAKSLGGRERSIVTVLVKRGILTKTAVAATNRRGIEHKYKWVATSSPTDTLYRSIAAEMRDNEAKWRKNRSQKLSVKNKPIAEDVKSDPVIVEPELPEVVNDLMEPRAVEINPLQGISLQELWEEMKRRGCFIKDGKLAVVQFFD